mgnify:CR=1 FL=1
MPDSLEASRSYTGRKALSVKTLKALRRRKPFARRVATVRVYEAYSAINRQSAGPALAYPPAWLRSDSPASHPYMSDCGDDAGAQSRNSPQPYVPAPAAVIVPSCCL